MAMTRNDRERQHRARLSQIEAVQVVAGTGDRARVNHERTLIERARMLAEELGSHRATENGLKALDRLLSRIERGGVSTPQDIGTFLEAVWNNKPLALGVLRAVDARTSDDMLEVLDAWRFARIPLAEHVKGGPRRLAQALKSIRAAA